MVSSTCPPCPPPHPTCAPTPPRPCPQVCPPPPPKPPCRVKPIMKRLHWTQTTSLLAQGFALMAIGGTAFVVLVKQPRYNAYKTYYMRAELDEYEDEMARKSLFKSVPKEALKENQHMKNN